MAEGDELKIQVDSDWKAQARAEKERLAKKPAETAAKPAAAAGAGAARGTQQIPPASFQTLVTTLATQALFAMGGIPDPRTGQRMAHLTLARHHIDLLGVLEEKTRNNLTEEETGTLAQTLYELRSRYIQAANAQRQGGQ